MGTPMSASDSTRGRLVRVWARKLAQKLQSEHVRIPKFDPKDKVHKRLAELSIQAHELAKTPASDKPQASSSKLAEIEAEVDVESAKLWDLSASDLAEVQRSLKELQA
jgi:hypothetical protein